MGMASSTALCDPMLSEFPEDIQHENAAGLDAAKHRFRCLSVVFRYPGQYSDYIRYLSGHQIPLTQFSDYHEVKHRLSASILKMLRLLLFQLNVGRLTSSLLPFTRKLVNNTKLLLLEAEESSESLGNVTP